MTLLHPHSCPSLPADPSDAYQAIWESFEQVSSNAMVAHCMPSLRDSEKGRAATRDVVVTSIFQGVVPKAREGEIGPAFFGSDRQYVLWFKQLRRIQALCQAVHRNTPSDAAVSTGLVCGMLS